jgi:hypothetical protein
MILNIIFVAWYKKKNPLWNTYFQALIAALEILLRFIVLLWNFCFSNRPTKLDIDFMK